MSKFYTTEKSYDGFGAQYQRIIQTYIYCKIHNLNFVYDKFDKVEHNYENDIEYINKLENLINLKMNIPNLDKNTNHERLVNNTVSQYFEKNIDVCCENEHLELLKKYFWENKSKNYFNNNKFNVAVQIRRENPHDRGQAGDRATTPNQYYLNIMNSIREKYKDKKIVFHIYSQGKTKDFMVLGGPDVYYHLNENIIETFIGMVSAKVLVLSPSSFSYIAGLLSDGEVYYKKFWHNPRKNWIICM
jgi:hypothetical protein